MFKLNPEEIKRLSSNNQIFLRGKNYFSQDRVDLINFNKNTYSFDMVVRGTYKYKVRIRFYKEGSLKSATCECPAYYEYMGYCKHIAASLIKIYVKDTRKEFDYLVESKIAEELLDYFSNIETFDKRTVNLQYFYEFIHDRNTMIDETYLSFKIGENKLYVVKNIKKFIECIKNNEILYFGKEFTFDPERHIFKDEDKPIIDLLLDFYDTEEALNNIDYSIKKPSLFSGKKAYLPQNAIKKFFEIQKNKYFNAIINNFEYENIKIEEMSLPIEFVFTKDNNALQLEVNSQNSILPLVENGEFIFSNKKIFKISRDYSKNLKPFQKALRETGKSIIKIPKKYNERFISEFYPVINKIGKVKIDEKVEGSIYNPGLRTEIYFDKIQDKITADIKFIYGDITIKAFNDKFENRNNERILLRKLDEEKKVIVFFEENDFKMSKNYIFLDNEDKIFEFIHDKLQSIQDIADVYYSESFKKIKIKNTASYSGGLRINNESNLLEFSFSIEGISNSELKEVFSNVKEKKKYYRLKNGSFLSLDDEELKEISELIDYLDLDYMNLENNNIPKYKALYIDEHIKSANMKSIRRDLKFKEMVQNVREPGDIDYTIPPELDNILREYQRFGFKWLKTLTSYGFGGILADDMGLGKTLQTLTFLLTEKIEKGKETSIIIAPTSLVYNWLEEINKFTPQLKTLVISGMKQEREELISKMYEYDVVITSYPLIRRDIDMYKDYKFRFCILDEAQHIKNSISQNASSVKEINAQNYFALTGTPIENSLLELWSIFDFIMPGYLFSKRKFIEKFEKPITKFKNKETLLELSRYIKPFILRRLKKDVLKELPEKIENKIIAELTEEQKKIYLAYLQKIKGEIEEEINNKGFDRSHIKILSAITRLRQICCHPAMFIENYDGHSGKLLLLEELIKEAIEGGHRILLFSQFTSMLSIIKEKLNNQGIEYVYLDGSTKMKERGKIINKFNEGYGKIFLISLKAGGTGLNLTAADTVIHYDIWWNPAVENQASDRAYRIGQKNTVHVMKLITKGTIEEKIFELQEKKKKLIDSVIKPGETLVSKLSEEEIKYLFDLK